MRNIVTGLDSIVPWNEIEWPPTLSFWLRQNMNGESCSICSLLIWINSITHTFTYSIFDLHDEIVRVVDVDDELTIWSVARRLRLKKKKKKKKTFGTEVFQMRNRTVCAPDEKKKEKEMNKSDPNSLHLLQTHPFICCHCLFGCLYGFTVFILGPQQRVRRNEVPVAGEPPPGHHEDIKRPARSTQRSVLVAFVFALVLKHMWDRFFWFSVTCDCCSSTDNEDAQRAEWIENTFGLNTGPLKMYQTVIVGEMLGYVRLCRRCLEWKLKDLGWSGVDLLRRCRCNATYVSMPKGNLYLDRHVRGSVELEHFLQRKHCRFQSVCLQCNWLFWSLLQQRASSNVHLGSFLVASCHRKVWLVFPDKLPGYQDHKRLFLDSFRKSHWFEQDWRSEMGAMLEIVFVARLAQTINTITKNLRHLVYWWCKCFSDWMFLW